MLVLEINDPLQMLYKPNYGKLTIFRFIIILKMIPISL